MLTTNTASSPKVTNVNAMLQPTFLKQAVYWGQNKASMERPAGEFNCGGRLVLRFYGRTHNRENRDTDIMTQQALLSSW
jgi:hypothetical protein